MNKAKEFAKKKHGDQKDDNGCLYFDSHIEQVVNILKLVTADDEVISAAYLHDTLEDTDTTLDELVECFGSKIALLVNELTYEGKKDSGGYYFPRLKSKEAILIKFADRLSNLGRMDCWNEKRQQHYLNKSKFWRNLPIKSESSVIVE